MIKSDTIHVGLAQMAPVWLNKSKTISKIEKYIIDAGNQDCDLIVF